MAPLAPGDSRGSRLPEEKKHVLKLIPLTTTNNIFPHYKFISEK